MKKLIIIEDSSEIKVGDVLHEPNNLNNETKFYKVYDRNGLTFFRFRNIPIKLTKGIHSAKKVQLYIVDTEIKNKTGYVYKKDVKGQIFKHHPSTNNWYNDAVAVIATSNPSLPIPQLSKQAIELIVENNGEIGEFDITFSSIDCEGKISSKQYKDYNFDEYQKVANIIPKPPEQSIEEAAEEYAVSFTGREIATLTIKDAFIAGAKSNIAKEYWQQNMSSYDDVSHAIGYTFGQCKQGLSHEQILIEYNKVHRKPYNSKAKEYHIKNMYSEEEVLNLFLDYNNHLNEFGEGLPMDKWFELNKKK